MAHSQQALYDAGVTTIAACVTSVTNWAAYAQAASRAATAAYADYCGALNAVQRAQEQRAALERANKEFIFGLLFAGAGPVLAGPLLSVAKDLVPSVQRTFPRIDSTVRNVLGVYEREVKPLLKETSGTAAVAATKYAVGKKVSPVIQDYGRQLIERVLYEPAESSISSPEKADIPEISEIFDNLFTAINGYLRRLKVEQESAAAIRLAEPPNWGAMVYAAAKALQTHDLYRDCPDKVTQAALQPGFERIYWLRYVMRVNVDYWQWALDTLPFCVYNNDSARRFEIVQRIVRTGVPRTISTASKNFDRAIIQLTKEGFDWKPWPRSFVSDLGWISDGAFGSYAPIRRDAASTLAADFADQAIVARRMVLSRAFQPTEVYTMVGGEQFVDYVKLRASALAATAAHARSLTSQRPQAGFGHALIRNSDTTSRVVR